MATYWVSSVGNDTTGDGSSYATAWLTVDKVITTLNGSGVAGDIINVVNDGGYAMPTTATALTRSMVGTDYDTDPGLVIRGVESDGTTASAVTFTSDSGDAGAAFVSFQGSVNYIDIKGFKFDLSPLPDATGAVLNRMRDAGTGPLRWTDCHFVGAADANVNMMKAVRRVYDFSVAGPNDWGEARYCIFQNCGDPFEVGGGTTSKLLIHHCVFWIKGEWSDTVNASVKFRSVANAGNIAGFYYNTIYYDVNDSVSEMMLANPASGDYGTVNFHSNVAWVETSVGSNKLSEFFGGASGSSATWAGTIGFNTMYAGPSVASGDLTNAHYEEPWDEPGPLTPKANDNVAYEQAASVLFEDATSTLAWPGSGDGYTLTVPGDLRMKVLLTSSKDSSVPGALGAAETDLSVTNTSDIAAPEPGVTVTLTITAANNGSVDGAVTVSVPAPSGLTYVSDTPTAGSYDSGTGVWTVGSLADAASETLTLVVTVDSDQAGVTVSVPATISGSLTDTDATNDTATVTLSVVNTSDPLDPDNPAAAPFIDVLPLVAPVLSMDMLVKLQVDDSRERIVYERGDFENEVWSECAAKRQVVATNTTVDINLGGIERGEFLILNASTAVDVSIATGTVPAYWTNVKTLVIARGDFSKITVRNQSLTLSSTIIVGATN